MPEHAESKHSMQQAAVVVVGAADTVVGVAGDVPLQIGLHRPVVNYQQHDSDLEEDGDC